MSFTAHRIPLSIMYVEDDPVTRELVALTLPKRFPDCKIHTAENGKQGLELYGQHFPDLVITDVNMPVMNGILMAAEIKALNPDVVIIAVTAYSETNYLLNAIEIGISHYVLKPIDYRKLFDAIEKSTSVIYMRKQFAEQNEMICDLNACLEQRALDFSIASREFETLTYCLTSDLRLPLVSLKRYISLLRQVAGERLSEEELSLLDGLNHETETVESLIEGVNQFYRAGNRLLNKENVNLTILARQIAEELQLREPVRSVQFKISEDIVVNGDEQLLRVVLDKLLGNAWRFTENTPDALIELGAASNHGVVACFVRDNGAGFDAAVVNKIFHELRQHESHGQFAGCCTDFATVQRIIHRHGGWIEAAAEPGKGATFTFVV